MESISLNGEAESKIKQVTVETRRTRCKRKLNDLKLDKKPKRQLIRDTCINNLVE